MYSLFHKLKHCIFKWCWFLSRSTFTKSIF